MLEKAKNSPAIATLDASETRDISVTFEPAKPFGSQFTFGTPNKKPYLVIDDLQTQITFTLNKDKDAVFPPSSQITWASNPFLHEGRGDPRVDLLEGGKKISFSVDPPEQYVFPWIINLNVDYGGVRNIASQAFFLVKRPPAVLEFDLVYGGDGSFDLRSHETGAPVFTLVSQQILINVLPATYKFDLQSTAFPDATFDNDQPIVWGNGTPGTPGRRGLSGTEQWITRGPEGEKSLTIKICQEPPVSVDGQSTGFQFCIKVNGVTVASPDPIIVNATIGDG